MEEKYQLKLITKRDFDKVKSKYKEIKPEAESVIEKATNDLDVLALSVQEGSGFTIFDARILNEDQEDNILEIFKEGTF